MCDDGGKRLHGMNALAGGGRHASNLRRISGERKRRADLVAPPFPHRWRYESATFLAGLLRAALLGLFGTALLRSFLRRRLGRAALPGSLLRAALLRSRLGRFRSLLRGAGFHR